MILIICTSHLYVPATLSIIDKEKSEFAIFSDRKSVITFFSMMYPEQTCFLDTTPNSANMVDSEGSRLGRIMNMTLGVYKRKKTIKKVFDNLNIDRIYFFHEGFSHSANWLMLRLHLKYRSKVYYYPVARSFDYHQEKEWNVAKPLKYKIQRFYDYLVWGYSCYYCNYKKIVMPVMSASYYNNINCKEIDLKITDNGILSQINERLLDEKLYPRDGIILLENTIRGAHVKFSVSSYEEFIESFITQIGPNNIFFKGHPDMAMKYGKEKELKEIPSFIPGNLLLKRFLCIICPLSDMLFEAANVGTPAISTLYLLEMADKDRQMFVDYLKSKNSNIMFPRSLNELIETINNIKKADVR